MNVSSGVNALCYMMSTRLSKQSATIDTERAEATTGDVTTNSKQKARKEIGQVGCAGKSSRLVSAVRRTMFNTENRDTRRYQIIVGWV